MTEKEKSKKEPEKRRADAIHSVQPIDTSLAAFIARECKHEQPKCIDAYPVNRRGEKLERLYHYDIKPSERIDAERAAELANIILADCQIHCDNRPGTRSKDGSHGYIICVVDDKRGGAAYPVSSRSLRLDPRAIRPAPLGDAEEDEDAEGHDGLTARKMMLESVRIVHDRDKWDQEHQGAIVGEVLLAMKGALADREHLIVALFDKNLAMIGEFRQFAQQVAERRVEEQAVRIDAENAAAERADRAAKRSKEYLWDDVLRASLSEAVKGLGQLFPGFGELFLAHLKEQPRLGDSSAVPGNGSASTTAPASTPPATTVPEEKQIIDRFNNAAESHQIDATHTAADKLFGKDDDAGQPVEPGVFTRDQVAILAGVRTGTLDVEALNALVPESGDPRAVTLKQMVDATAYLTPPMFADFTKFLTLRKTAHKKTH